MTLLERSRTKAEHFWEGFIEFAFQGKILQIAFGLILAAHFTDLVRSSVGDVLMPPISIIPPLHKNMEEKFSILRVGVNCNTTTGYNTMRQALEDGAVVMAWGLYTCVSFIMVGFSLYSLAQVYQLASHDPIIKVTKKCKYCRQSISEKASRCVSCTSWQDGGEDRARV